MEDQEFWRRFFDAIDKTQLTRAILSFYCDNPNYKMSKHEFIGIICILSNQIMQDIGWKTTLIP